MADKLSKFNIKGTWADLIDIEARSELESQSESMSEIQSEIDSQSVAYSEMFSEVDDNIASKQDAIVYDTAYTGNIDELDTLSLVFCVASSVSGTTPWSTGFFIIETFKASGPTYLQKAYQYSNAGIPEVAYRMHANNQWYPWKHVTLT